ncbi:hypothetical protein STXM2123_5713 [Streptomyces sp. F-3]|nr:hypothetical protein STXM2123_5713 [Streptomyces sp. F-3]
MPPRGRRRARPRAPGAGPVLFSGRGGRVHSAISVRSHHR